jgi:hypothetical protein
MPAQTIGAEELAGLALYLRGAEFPAGAQQLTRISHSEVN